MTNLIPSQAQQTVRREYISRVLIVWGFLLAGVCIAVASMLVPTLILLQQQSAALASEYERLANTDESQYRQARDALADANAVAAQLDGSPDGIPASRILARIQANLSSTVSLQGFSYTDGGDVQVQMRGTATTRDALAAFTQALERDPLFVRADVPVSNLAQDVNISFTAALTLREGEEE